MRYVEVRAGVVEHVDEDTLATSVVLGDGQGARSAQYSVDDAAQLALAWAITVPRLRCLGFWRPAQVHKAQGGEHDAVIIPLFLSHYSMLSRHLLYTAITRARKLVLRPQ